MIKQPDEACIKMGELMPVMLVNLSQYALRAMLLHLRQRIDLDELTQLLDHGFAFNHKMADKPRLVSEL